MTVAFLTNYIYTPHYETELELIQDCLDKGDTVYHFVCNSDLMSCDFNPYHDLLKCSFCISKRRKGQRLLTNTSNYVQVKIGHPSHVHPYPKVQHQFESIAELRNYKIDNFEIGDAALSSLVTIVREPAPDIQAHEELLANIILSANFAYHYFQEKITEYGIIAFYNFNGRFAVNRAILRASQKAGIFSYIIERGSNAQNYELFENVLPHEILPFTERTLKFWDDHPLDEEEKARMAHDFYKERVKGKEQGWLSFVTEQKPGLLPENWNHENENIVIFTSSEDEYVSIGEEWDLGVFISQNDLILKLAQDVRLSEKKIWVRLHPNMKLMNKSYLEKLYETLQGNLELILPDSPINSYDLMKAASKILTFGSTVGIEATYWGKSSILIGPGFYMHFDVTYNPATYEELIDLILKQDLKPRPNENTLKFGFYTNNFGFPFRTFKPDGLFHGQFKNQDLNAAFDFGKWESLSHQRGFHWFYHRLNKLQYRLLRSRYV